MYAFRCFGRATLALQYPGRLDAHASELNNVNLILGDNGGGKSSTLRAMAIAILAPALMNSGFVPFRLVRREKPEAPEAKASLLRVDIVRDTTEFIPGFETGRHLQLLARIDRGGRGGRDRIHLERVPESPILQVLDDDYSPAFFVVGYGATRRVETGQFTESSSLRSRGLRYQRIASLFEDQVTLRPLQAWLRQAESKGRLQEVARQINRVLPENIRFTGAHDDDEDQYTFSFNGLEMPFSSLSDGYKAFIGWVCDLIGHLVDVAPSQAKIDEVPGIVLVDEIDLHLHPEWQRHVVPTLAEAFPRLQFIFTSHSPMVASTVRRENVFVTANAEDGSATIKQLEERVYGRSAEDLLLSSYFGLQTTRPEGFQDEAQNLLRKATLGNSEAGLSYLQQLTSGGRK